MRASIVKDPKLAPEGRRKIRWVESHSPVLNALYERRLSDGALPRSLDRRLRSPRGEDGYLTSSSPTPAPAWPLAAAARGYVPDEVAAAVADVA